LKAEHLKERLQTIKLTADELKSLYNKHGPALVAYACSCGLDFTSAEDVVQQVFLRMLQAQLSKPEVPVAYLYRATRNACLNHRRDRMRETELPEAETWLLHSGGDQEQVLTLQKALRDLPEEQREAVFLRIWSGMTLSEIASATGTSLNTVASRYRYALEKLRYCLEPHLQKPRGGNADG
jgi:RNA polymerase sigma-70 factor, ECF subfamily